MLRRNLHVNVSICAAASVVPFRRPRVLRAARVIERFKVEFKRWSGVMMTGGL